MEISRKIFKGKKVVNNEKNASENAIKLLKESGASENELKLAKESLDKSLESYKEEHKMYYKSPFINKLQSFRKIRRNNHVWLEKKEGKGSNVSIFGRGN